MARSTFRNLTALAPVIKIRGILEQKVTKIAVSASAHILIRVYKARMRFLRTTGEPNGPEKLESAVPLCHRSATQMEPLAQFRRYNWRQLTNLVISRQLARLALRI